MHVIELGLDDVRLDRVGMTRRLVRSSLLKQEAEVRRHARSAKGRILSDWSVTTTTTTRIIC